LPHAACASTLSEGTEHVHIIIVAHESLQAAH